MSDEVDVGVSRSGREIGVCRSALLEMSGVLSLPLARFLRRAGIASERTLVNEGTNSL